MELAKQAIESLFTENNLTFTVESVKWLQPASQPKSTSAMRSRSESFAVICLSSERKMSVGSLTQSGVVDPCLLLYLQLETGASDKRHLCIPFWRATETIWWKVITMRSIVDLTRRLAFLTNSGMNFLGRILPSKNWMLTDLRRTVKEISPLRSKRTTICINRKRVNVPLLECKKAYKTGRGWLQIVVVLDSVSTVHSPLIFRVFSIDERAVRTARELDASVKRKKQGGGGRGAKKKIEGL